MLEGMDINLTETFYVSNLRELALSVKGWRLWGCSCSKYSKINCPGEVLISAAPLDGLLLPTSDWPLGENLFNYLCVLNC